MAQPQAGSSALACVLARPGARGVRGACYGGRGAGLRVGADGVPVGDVLTCAACGLVAVVVRRPTNRRS
jgi:hypothetical protein